MNTQTKITQGNLTPQLARQILVEGNELFVQNVKAPRNLQNQVKETSQGQFPFAVILSCIDSRVPAELVFDQGIGDVFSARVAGNVVNEDVLGSMEYACKVAGSKIVVVMGHTKCGAVTAACKSVELGNITTLLNKIQPAVNIVKAASENTQQEMSDASIEEVTKLNIELSIDRIRKESPILAEMEQLGEIEIVGALYSVATGKITFFEG
ncbi:MAG: carbonic anhydrase family protein [Polaribacter sp.]|nr:carbonic anhydrase family protein [Polaribacter sp.]